MTDNRTTELLKDYAFTLRQLEYAVDKPGSNMTLGEYEAEEKRVTDEYEQAIAATLGSEREKRLEKLVRIYGEISNYFCERFACCDAEFSNCKYCIGLPQSGQCELGWCNDESKALGIEQPDYGGGECEPVNLEELYDRIGELENERTTHGTLTAEQVRETVLKHGNVMGPRFYGDWQAIADELNAEVGGTCELIYDDEGVLSCSQCGRHVDMIIAGEDNFCSGCGRRIQKAVKR